MADRTQPKAPRRDAGLFGQVPIGCAELIIQSMEEHWDQTAEVRHDDPDVGVTMRDAGDDHMKRDNGVFHRRTHRAREIEIIEQWRTQAIYDRVKEQDG